MNALSAKVFHAGLVAALGLAASLPAAGIPEPPLILVGKVTGASGQPIVSGTARISVGREGATPIVKQVALGSYAAGNGDIYSYIASIPMETLATGFTTLSPDALELPSAPARFSRAIEITAPAGAKSYSDVLTLGAADLRGGTLRYDFTGFSGTATPTPTATATPTPTSGPFCTGDADHSGFVNLNDYRAVRDNFGRVSPPQGDADGDGFVNLNDYRAVRDNFGRACAATKRFDPDAYKAGLAASTATLSLSSPAMVDGSGSFAVQVLLDASTTATGVVSAFVSYDPALVQFSSGTVNTTTFNSLTFTTPVTADSVNGFVSFSAGANTDLTSSGLLVATLNFTPTGIGKAKFDLSTTSPRVTELTNTSLQPVASTLIGSSSMLLPAGQPLLVIDPDTRTVGNGGTFSEDLFLYPNNSAPSGAGIFVSFNPSGLSFKGGSVNSTVFNNAIFTGAPTESTSGVIGFSAVANTALEGTTPVRVATLNFQALAAGEQTIAYLSSAPTQTVITNVNLDTIGTAAVGAKVTVTNVVATATPTPTPTPTASPISTTTPTPTVTPNPGADRVLSVPTTLVASPGGEVEILARIDNAAAISGYRLALAWDSTKASYVAGSASLQSTISQGCFAPSVNSSTAGQIIVSSACGDPLSGGGSLLRFRLLLANNLTTGSTVPITWVPSQTRLNDGAVNFTTVAGLVNVTSPFVWGDVACPLDGVSGTLDVSAILNYDAGLATNFPCYTQAPGGPAFPEGGDVNGDSVMGVLDASLILRYDALLISRFPADANGDGLGPDEAVSSSKSLAKAAPVALSLGDAVAGPDGVLDIPVVLADGSGLYGLRLAVSYDAAALAPLAPAVSFKNTAAAGWVASTSAAEGQLRFSAAGSEALPSGEVVVAHLRFKALRPSAGTTSVAPVAEGSRANDGGLPLVLKGSAVHFGPSSSVADWPLF